MNQNTKRLLSFLFVAFFAVATILVLFFVPVFHISASAPTSEPVDVVVEDVSLIDFARFNPFIEDAGACATYFEASGPMWLPVAFILSHFIVIVLCSLMTIVAIIELITFKNGNINFKKNALAKKLGILTGVLTMLTFVLSLISFLITTKMAQGYATFKYNTIGYFLFVLGLLIFMFSLVSSKSEKNQEHTKARNAVGFLLTFLSCVVAILMFFVPVYNKYFLGENRQSFWKIGEFATVINPVEFPIGAEYAFGISQWIMLASMALAVFVTICAIVGFVATLAGREARWVSLRAKRWSLILGIILFVFWLFQCAIISVVSVSFINFDLILISPLYIVFMFVTFLPIVFSNIISTNKQR